MSFFCLIQCTKNMKNVPKRECWTKRKKGISVLFLLQAWNQKVFHQIPFLMTGADGCPDVTSVLSWSSRSLNSPKAVTDNRTQLHSAVWNMEKLVSTPKIYSWTTTTQASSPCTRTIFVTSPWSSHFTLPQVMCIWASPHHWKVMWSKSMSFSCLFSSSRPVPEREGFTPLDPRQAQGRGYNHIIHVRVLLQSPGTLRYFRSIPLLQTMGGESWNGSG